VVGPLHGNIRIVGKRSELSIRHPNLGMCTSGRLLSAKSVKVGNGFRLALPTGAYHTGKGAVLEGTPIEPDHLIEFDGRGVRAISAR
jgi:hypothetical protein